MAHYPWSTNFPTCAELQRQYSDQSQSRVFQGFTIRLCEKAGITIDELTNTSTEYLQSQRHRGLEDLAVFMCFLIQKFKLKYALDSQPLYKAVKGIPYHSHGKMGYTFERKRSGIDRGVFIFLL